MIQHKKKQIVIGTIAILALVSNFLLPGTAFSQGDQIIGLDIECGPWGITLGASSFEMAVRQIDLTYMRAYGSVIGGETYQDGSNTMPGEAFLKIEDYRTSAPGCAVEPGTDGWTVRADFAPGYTGTYNFGDGNGHTFHPGNFYVITTNNFDASATGADIDTDYSIQGPSNLYQFWYPNDYSDAYDIRSTLKTESSQDLTSLNCFITQNCTSPGYSGYNDFNYGEVYIVRNNDTVGDYDRYRDVTLYVGLAYCLRIYSTSVTASSYPYTSRLEYTMVIED